ncbi:hypothetical protein RDWZM_009839 [Blomia tropicalis]|uniref:Uncharacterized protein n=1 Tax=Blomia tropicalis TaxID=40697 RepID=A0A9Q0LXL1_BLOTA|nr:hypothetical protein RDWZM_009839 [Blomia tropicalis]
MQELLERMETTMNDFERANVVVDSAQLLIRASRIMNDLLAKHLSLSITASEHLQDTGTKECRFFRILLDEKGLAYYPDIRHITEHCYYVPKIIRKTLIDNNELCYDYFYPGHTFDLCPFMDRYYIRHTDTDTEHCYYVRKTTRKMLIDDEDLCYGCFYLGHTFDLQGGP